ncbi:hypothetical protein ACVNIS_05970 [Sphaerotilaceae bacterium SBD11-9]
MFADMQKTYLQQSAGSTETRGTLPPAPSAPTDAMRQMTDLTQRTMASWAALAKGLQSKPAAVDPELLRKLFNPVEWSQVLTNGIDSSLERLTEAPTLAGVSSFSVQ